MLGGQAAGAALPGQLPHDLAVGRAEVGVGLQPAGPALLLAAQGQLVVVGPVGLLAGHQRGGPVGRGRPDPPGQTKHPLPSRCGSLLVVSCVRAWSASARRALAR